MEHSNQSAGNPQNPSIQRTSHGSTSSESGDQFPANQKTNEEHIESGDQMLANKGIDEKQTEEMKLEEELSRAPDGGWGWMIVLGACFTHVIMGAFERSNGILYLQLRDEFQQSATATSWVTSIFSTLRLFMGPLASALCNRFSCRFVVMLGSVMCTIGVIISAYAPNLTFLYFSYGILGGIGRSLTYTPSLIIVGYYFNKKRGVAVGLSTSGVGIGTFIFPPVMEVLFNHYGYEGSFLILGATISNFFICGALFRSLELHKKILRSDRLKLLKQQHNCDGKEKLLKGVPSPTSLTKHQQMLLQDQSAAKMTSSMDIIANAKIESRRLSLFNRKFTQVKLALKGSESSGKDKKKLLDLSLFRNYAFTALCLQLFLFTLSFNTTFAYLPALAKEKGISQLEGAYLVSILGIFDALARIIMSIILDLKRVKPYRLIIYNIVMFLVAVISLLIPSMVSFWQFSLVSGAYGIFSGTYISQKSVVVVDILGVEKLASSFGLLLLFQGVSAFVGPTVGGLFKDYLGNYDMAFYFGSIGIFAGGLMMASANIWLYRQRKKQESQLV